MDKPLTKKQQEFCIYYINNGFNAYEAALSAGYSKTYAYSRAHALPSNPIIHKRLSEGYQKAAEKLGITFEWKVQILEKIINTFIKEENKPLPPQDAKVVIQAIGELNRMQGDLSPKKQLNVNVEATMGRLAEARRIYDEY